MAARVREGLAPGNKITDAGVCEHYSGSTRMLLQGETSRERTEHSEGFFHSRAPIFRLMKLNRAGLTDIPVYKVVFVEVQKPWGNVTRHSLEDQRVRSLGVSHPAAVQVALQITLRGERKWDCEILWQFLNTPNNNAPRKGIIRYVRRTE